MIIWFHLKQSMNNFLWFYPHFCGYFLLFLIAPQLQNGQVCTCRRFSQRMLQMCCTSSTRGFFDYANATLRMTAHQRVRAIVLRQVCTYRQNVRCTLRMCCTFLLMGFLDYANASLGMTRKEWQKSRRQTALRWQHRRTGLIK